MLQLVLILSTLMAAVPARENIVQGETPNPEALPFTRLALIVTLNGEDLQWSVEALRKTIADHYAAKGVEIVDQPDDTPAEESVPVIKFSISAGPEVCRRHYFRADSDYCDRFSVEFWEPVILLRDRGKIFMLPTVELPVTAGYRDDEESYRQAMRPEQLQQGTRGLLDWLDQVLTGTFPGWGPSETDTPRERPRPNQDNP